jgi:ribosomal protein S27AE
MNERELRQPFEKATPACPNCLTVMAWLRSSLGEDGTIAQTFTCAKCGAVETIDMPGPERA